jgi:hypothetical protein
MTAQTPFPVYVNMAAIRSLVGIDDKQAYWTDNTTLCVEGVSQASLDSAMTSYYADQETYVIEPMRDDVKSDFSTKVYSFISDRYSVQTQQMFQALLTEASITGLTNRMTYIQQLLDWVKTVVSANIATDDAVDAATTPEQILAITLDLSPFEATNPNITVKGALAIVD